jgi:uncharacterized membrane protein YoaK (UPF0700 family)
LANFGGPAAGQERLPAVHRDGVKPISDGRHGPNSPNALAHPLRERYIRAAATRVAERLRSRGFFAAVLVRWAAGRALHRGHLLLAAATSVQAAVVLVACVIASIADVGGSAARLTLIGLLVLAMGGQNAVVRRLALAGLTTTVLTLTVTGLVADSAPRSMRTRRLVSILAMLMGALTGGVLLRWVTLAAPLWLGAVLLVACATGAYLAARRPQSRAWR